MDYNETVKKLKFEILSNMQNLLVFLTTNSLEKGNFISTINIQIKPQPYFKKYNTNYRNGELYK
ncbi:MAG TPA: hypothetical protein DHU62_01540 [Firmicutes bacterium]|nr:hypothetical protein [Bacillota bacterium]